MDHGGTAESARQLGADEHAVVKTLVMQDQDAKPLLILMHGDREVSLKNFARQIGVKKVAPCKPDAAQRHTGYQVGGTSPFGTRKTLPVMLERSILACPRSTSTAETAASWSNSPRRCCSICSTLNRSIVRQEGDREACRIGYGTLITIHSLRTPEPKKGEPLVGSPFS